MDSIKTNLTIKFDGTYWIGVFEEIKDNKIRVAKYTFGAEPREIEVYKLVLNKYNSLKFSESIIHKEINEKKINPKRMKREIKKKMNESIGTKSMQALKLEHEKNKKLRKQIFKNQKEKNDLRKFKLKQQKRLEKHKGR